MKRRREIIALIIALGLLAVVLIGRRWAYQDAYEPKYHAALYFAHIKAIDDLTSEPINIEIRWDYELITPYIKGSGPSIIQTHADKSVTVALVGKKLEHGMRIGIVADGYHREGLQIDPNEGGSTEVRLRRKDKENATRNKE